MLVDRLERLSADSYWAHQASGLRGSLLRCLEQLETGQSIAERSPGRQDCLDQLLERGFAILVCAAKQLHAPEL
jgi:hypothetical protein